MIRVRPAIALDEDAAVALWQAACAARGERSGGPRAQRTRALLRSPRALTLLAVDGEAVVGVLVATLADEPGVLELALLEAPGRGAERALLASLTRRYPRVRAWPRAGQEATFGLAGFRASGARRDDGVELLETTDGSAATT